MKRVTIHHRGFHGSHTATILPIGVINDDLGTEYRISARTAKRLNDMACPGVDCTCGDTWAWPYYQGGDNDWRVGAGTRVSKYEKGNDNMTHEQQELIEIIQDHETRTVRVRRHAAELLAAIGIPVMVIEDGLGVDVIGVDVECAVLYIDNKEDLK